MSYDPSGLTLAETIRQVEEIVEPVEEPSTPIMLEAVVRGDRDQATAILHRLEEVALLDDRVTAVWSGVSGEVDRGRLFPDTPELTDDDLRRQEHPREFVKPARRRGHWWFR